MAVALGATGWWMYVEVPDTPKAVVICVIIYNAAFGYRYVSSALWLFCYSLFSSQLGTLTLVISSRGSFGSVSLYELLLTRRQIMPLTVRAKGVSLSTSTNWAFNFLVGEATPYLQELIEWRLYPMHGFFCVCSFVMGQ